jgi:8-oxo-dGTP pyrophosphatase MutT (NUDIX family)
VEPRPAATVIVARSIGPAQTLEFLVLRRAAISRFAPGFVVFPGGVIEPEDENLAGRWFGDVGQAARACALRELAEETGLVMTSTGLVEGPGRLPGEPGLRPPVSADVPEIARWIAPEFLPVRFDARFFALAAERELRPVPDGVEIETAWWATADDLLAGARAGEVQLMWPTLRTLEALAGCRTTSDVLELRVEAVQPAAPAAPAAPAGPPTSAS